MSAAQPLSAETTAGPVRCTPDEYLLRERAAQEKSEYYQGEAWPMVGASLKHARIVRSLVTRLTTLLDQQSFEVLHNDVRVRAGENYFYPDVLIVEGEPQLEDVHQDTILNPAAVIEVLSPSTEAFDRGRKFAAYRSASALREYVLVSQDRPRVEHYRRLPGDAGQWLLTIAEGLDASIILLEDTAGACRLTLREIYQWAGFEEQGENVQAED